MPITYAKTDEQVEEERRLLYVGVTRAREQLVPVVGAGAHPRAAGPTRRPSRFLDGAARCSGRRLGRTRGGARRGRGRGAGSVRSSCRSCGATLTTAANASIGRCDDCPSDMDERLFERLRDWRSDRPEAAGVPAFVVFTDETLAAIAEQVPADVPALARIPGVGPAKLDRYGDAVLALCEGTSLRGE